MLSDDQHRQTPLDFLLFDTGRTYLTANSILRLHGAAKYLYSRESTIALMRLRKKNIGVSAALSEAALSLPREMPASHPQAKCWCKVRQRVSSLRKFPQTINALRKCVAKSSALRAELSVAIWNNSPLSRQLSPR